MDSTARGLGSASISSFRRTAVCMYRSPTLTDCGAETLRFLQKFSQDSVCTVTKAENDGINGFSLPRVIATMLTR